jgi:penicillin-binding protein 1A
MTTSENKDLIKDQDNEIQLKEMSAKTFFTKDLKEDYIYDRRLSYVMSSLLKGVIQNGTAKTAKALGPYFGGKTGTTNSYIDAWFIGGNTKILAGVWVGMDDNTTMGYGETGGKSALPIWHEFMEFYIKKYGHSDFRSPEGIENILIDKASGLLPDQKTKETQLEAFVSGQGPGSHSSNIPQFTPFKNSDVNDQQKKEIYDDEEYYYLNQ